nr:hypothetical protein [Cupriavidus gilardii]
MAQIRVLSTATASLTALRATANVGARGRRTTATTIKTITKKAIA